MIKITTTFVDNLVPAPTTYLTAELDSRPFPEGKNNTPGQVHGGDAPYFLVYKSDDVAITRIMLSMPKIQAVPRGLVYVRNVYDVATVGMVEHVHFSNSKTGSTSKQVDSEFAYRWEGNDLGVLTPSRNTLKAQRVGVAVAGVTYRTKALLFQISGIPAAGAAGYELLVVIEGMVQ